MVKVLPSNFTFYESQRILSPAGEPLAIACSNELLFIAVEECMIEAYDLRTLEQLAQFRTVSPVAQVAYNSRGDCVVTLERKHSVSQGFVRVYFKWRGLSADKPMRILMASIQRSIPGQNRMTAEIVELPSDSGNSVSCLACCEYTGRIAVGMGSLLRVFTVEREEHDNHDSTAAGRDIRTPSSPSSSLPPPFTSTSLPSPSASHPSPSSSLPPPSPPSPTPSIEILLDIQTDCRQLERISIMGDYVAFISTNEARVVKLSLFQTGTDPIPDYSPLGAGNRRTGMEGLATGSPRGNIVKDKNFVSWSPSAVWEAEKKANSSKSETVDYARHVTSHDAGRETLPVDMATKGQVTSHDITSDHMTSHDITSDHMTSHDITSDHMTSHDITSDHMTSHDRAPCSSSQPLIGTLNLESITLATSERQSDRSTMEVLGPVEYVWGQPLSVRVNQLVQSVGRSRPDCRVLTMLYRRFSASVVGAAAAYRLTGQPRSRRATLPVRVQGGGGVGLGIEGGWDGLHTVELVPTFAKG